VSDHPPYGDLLDRFSSLFGRPAAGIWAAPGRVNLIGEHTDYNDGLVLPFALEQRTFAAVAPRDDGVLRVRSVQLGGGVSTPVESLAAGSVEGWPAYAAGVVWALRTDGHDVPGMDVLLDGRVPAGSGLSSSASLECAVAVAAAELARLSLGAAALARVAQHAENDFVGVPCGLMDQMASMACTDGHALLFDVQSGEAVQVPFAPESAGLALLVVDTRVSHDLGDGAYADRRAACERAAAALGVPSLRSVSPADLDASLSKVGAADAPRMRHVVTEIARVQEAVAALRASDWATLGDRMVESHESLRDDYDVSCAELDAAVEAALAAGAVGARMTGGGFGGSAIALVPVGEVDDVTSAVESAFADRGFRQPTVTCARPSAGAGRVA
jgi:galactokinase